MDQGSFYELNGIHASKGDQIPGISYLLKAQFPSE